MIKKMTEVQILQKAERRNHALINEAKNEIAENERNTVCFGIDAERTSDEYILPTLLWSAANGENVLVIDPEGTLYEKSKEAVQAIHVETNVINAKVSTKNNAVDLFMGIRNADTDQERIAQINKVIDILLKDKEQSKDFFWTMSTKSLLEALIYYVVCSPEYYGGDEHRDIGAVYDLIIRICAAKGREPGIERGDKTIYPFGELPETSTAKKLWSIYEQSPDKIRITSCTNLSMELSVFEDIHVVELFREGIFDAECAKKQGVYYITCSPEESYYRMYMQAAINTFYEIMKGAKTHAHILLSDFRGIGTIPKFDTKLNTSAKDGIRYSIICNNPLQIEMNYPGKGKCMRNKCCQIIMPN